MKEIMKIFENDIFHQHYINNQTNLIKYLNSIYDTYLISLNATNEDDKQLLNLNQIIPFIEKLSQCIINTLEVYFLGEPAKSYKIFSIGFNEIWSHIEAFCNRKYEMIKLFRCRQFSPNDKYSKEDIYHIPFEKRYKVKNQRYSINGYPCLYLGSSLLDCINEINENYNDYYLISIYRLMKHSPKVLDLTIDYNQIYHTTLRQEGIAEYFLSFIRQAFISKLILFPMICATSIKNLEDHVFKSEYIIPQLLLEWTRETQNIDCIKYYSHLNFGNCKNTKFLTNYVFPLKSKKYSGYCDEVLNYFNITEPKIYEINYNNKNLDSILLDYFNSGIGTIEKEL